MGSESSERDVNLVDLRFFAKGTKGVLRGYISALDLNQKTVSIRLLGKFKHQLVHVVFPLSDIRLNYYIINSVSTFVDKTEVQQQTEWELLDLLFTEQILRFDATKTVLSHGVGKFPRIMFMSRNNNFGVAL